MLLHFVTSINISTAYFPGHLLSQVQCPVIPDYNSVTTFRDMCTFKLI